MSKIISLNINSAKSFMQKKLLENFIRDNRADIYFFQETHLNHKDNFNMANYNTFRQDRKHKNGGGTMILLNCAIKFRNYKKFEDGIEFVSIEVFINNEWFRLMSVYVPPNINAQISAERFDEIFDSKLPVIAGGDFNARHITFGDHSNNQNGIKVREFIEGVSKAVRK